MSGAHIDTATATPTSGPAPLPDRARDDPGRRPALRRRVPAVVVVSGCARMNSRSQTRLVSVLKNSCNSCPMTFAQAKARHAELVEQIRRHDRAYDEGRPLITDYEYDLLERELLDLEKEFPRLATADSPSQQLRSEPL